MPLSEYEQRVLEQLEKDLGSDPKLGNAMAPDARPSSRYVWAGVGVVAGLGVVVAGAMTQIILLGVLGFAIMLGVAIWVLLAPKSPKVKVSGVAGAQVPGGSAGAAAKSGKGGKSASPKDRAFMDRMEERFDRRKEQGDI